MLRLMLLRLISVFRGRKRDTKNEICRFARSILPQGDALRAFLEEVRMLMEVERSLKGTINEETKSFANTIMLTVLLAGYCNKHNEKR